MSDIYKALEALTDAYMARGTNQDRVRAKYANYQRELEEARQQDIDEVAQALAAAWHAGASVAASGRAMGSSNIYNSRRAYYDRAKEIQGMASQDDNDFLDSLYRKVRGEVSAVYDRRGDIVETFEVETPDEESDSEQNTETEAWVRSWTVERALDGNWDVEDPQGRVGRIVGGYVLGKQNAAEFRSDQVLADLVTRVHDIETKVRN